MGTTVDEAAWWFITMERSCHVQLMAEAAGDPIAIDDEYAGADRRARWARSLAGWLSFQPLYDKIVADQPDLLD